MIDVDRTAFSGMFSFKGRLWPRAFVIRVVVLVAVPMVLLAIGLNIQAAQKRALMPVWSVLPLYVAPWCWACCLTQRLRDARLPYWLVAVGFAPALTYLAYFSHSNDLYRLAGHYWPFSWLIVLAFVIFLSLKRSAPDTSDEPAPNQGLVDPWQRRQRVTPVGRRRKAPHFSSAGQLSSSTIGMRPRGETQSERPADTVTPENPVRDQAISSSDTTHDQGLPQEPHRAVEGGGGSGTDGVDMAKAVFLVASVFGGAIIGLSVGERTEERVGGAFLGAILGGIAGWGAWWLSSQKSG